MNLKKGDVVELRVGLNPPVVGIVLRTMSYPTGGSLSDIMVREEGRDYRAQEFQLTKTDMNVFDILTVIPEKDEKEKTKPLTEAHKLRVERREDVETNRRKR